MLNWKVVTKSLASSAATMKMFGRIATTALLAVLAAAPGDNALGVPVSAGVLYPWTGLLLSPIFPSAAMTFGSVSVITNALRQRRVHL